MELTASVAVARLSEICFSRPAPLSSGIGNLSLTNVGIFVETDSSWGRNVARGVASYGEKFAQWNLLVDPHHSSAGWYIPPTWRPSGVISRISTPLMLRQLLGLGVPVVDVGDSFVGTPGIESVLTDYRNWAELAVTHLRSKGFEHFAYFAPPSRDYSNLRGREFAAMVESQGLKCAQYRPGYRVGREISTAEHHRRVARWLAQLSQPVAILAADAARGKSLAEVCHDADYAIPEQVAILAGDSDELSCEICTPPLSSIQVASRRIGYEAAARLAALMNREAGVDGPTLVAPDGIEPRQSTDVLAIDDAMVVRALRYMQANAYRGITVADVLAELPIARRQLERQFKRWLGRLPAEELRRLRLERSRQLLTDTELSMDQVAEACGYAGSTQFGAAFRRQYGVTPLSFRRRTQSS